MTPKKTLNFNGRLVDLSQPKVMGILNATPDSFYEKSRRTTVNEMLKSTERMIADGADFVDIGGYSSRPNADEVSVKEEIKRVSFISSIRKEFPEVIISIDTFRSEVARSGLDQGVDMVNDISGGHLDPKMIPMIGAAKVPYIAMHMRGTPQTMREHSTYDDLLFEISKYFADLKSKCHAAGIKDVIFDPGFGFAKTLEQNYFLLKNLKSLLVNKCPILVGLSRKSMIYNFLECSPNDALNGTTALNSVALFGGASILRVHDVKEAVETARLIGYLNDSRI